MLTFNESISAGTGVITLRDENNNLIEKVDVSSPNVTISGATLTFNPTADLAYVKNYDVSIEAGAVRDLAGNGTAW